MVHLIIVLWFWHIGPQNLINFISQQLGLAKQNLINKVMAPSDGRKQYHLIQKSSCKQELYWPYAANEAFVCN